jgi:SAM-dependent methyltransferase
MSDVARSYDEVPYEGKPLYATHPDCLAAAARLRCIPAADPAQCRVLELGCGTGGNLIPMAYTLPQSQFLGIDLSPRQIAWGQSIVQQAGLQNIELKVASILDVDRDWGQFDYIICHGVFSWVPRPVQDHILWICGNLLAPFGVAYISYNTYPGWHLRAVVRDLAQFYAARFDDPATKAQQVRAIVQFIARASASLDSPLSRYLAEEVPALAEAADYYIYHEHLEDTNHPLYFYQFMARARAAGLEYLGEAWHHSPLDSLPEEVRQTLVELSRDLVDLEQWMDFIHSRTFRRTLLCRAEVPVERTPPPDVLRPMYLTALARPQSPEVDVTTPQPERFVRDDGTGATTNVPLLKAALVALFQRWPAAVPFSELLQSAMAQANIPRDQQAQAEAVLAALLVRSYTSHLVAIHTRPFPFVGEAGPLPCASRLARVLAKEQARVPNLRHHLVLLSPEQRQVLAVADGRHRREEIAQALAVAAGQRGPPEGFAESAHALPPLSTPQVDEVLRQLARCALLEA